MTQSATYPTSLVDFTDPAFREAAAQMDTDHKSCYLMALAAWQRGLTVEFFGTQTEARVNIPNMLRQAKLPELYWITDGRRRHFFCFSMGDATTPEIGTRARNKDLTKQHFVKAGVRTPRSALWIGHNISEIQRFIAQAPGRTFVLKPEVGSLRRGVQLRVPAAQVIPKLSPITGATLVEEQIEGLEYRTYVVGDRVIGANAKPGVSVTGNGRETIAQLIHRKNALRLADPALKSYQIDLAAAVQYLAEFGQTATRVPALGERVVLSTSNNQADGGDGYCVIDTLNPEVAQMSVAACAAVGLPNGAVDLIFDGKQAYVLEVNVRAGLAAHSFPTVGPGQGNAVAEAIVDWYFPTPDSTPPRRHTALLDFTELLAAFAEHGTRTRFKIEPLQEPA